ncbi:ABC transporter ATP-binding protein [Methylobacterium aquaticum]|uniref:ABC transporter related n=1 Tax=Methylobacterium aquaticum TaxID=270351 RepID=A0A0C6EWH1_9HYPH|nr:ABC transporter ATP-binding protein [Methylobacterium aquaticum]BAQ44381.1 ABC transporter related [Methylobacterium aquaticum]
MKVQVRNRCSDFSSYRAARVKSLFNAENGCDFDLDADLDIDDDGWSIGVVVGPSGSGKTSIGRMVFGGPGAFWEPAWPADRPIVDCIAPDGDFDAVTGALGSVGLGTVPTWLRPYPVLSNGEKFRADLARLVVEAPAQAVVDEFTSVVDRQIAKFGALAFSKAWRRQKGCKVVLLTPHYDVIEWLEPDWVFDTAKKTFARGRRRRPSFDLEIWKVDGSYWPLFEPHHYLKLPRMVAASYYLGTVDGELACHIAVSSINKGKAVEARACRLVTMPEWQGAGVGFRFLNEICAMQERGDADGRLPGRITTTVFHTSHPQLCAALRRDQRWRQISAVLHGTNKAKSIATIKRAGTKAAQGGEFNTGTHGYGGHFRAVQGFRFYGAKGLSTNRQPESRTDPVRAGDKPG